jgi:hypothetical protein
MSLEFFLLLSSFSDLPLFDLFLSLSSFLSFLSLSLLFLLSLSFLLLSFLSFLLFDFSYSFAFKINEIKKFHNIFKKMDFFEFSKHDTKISIRDLSFKAEYNPGHYDNIFY